MDYRNVTFAVVILVALNLQHTVLSELSIELPSVSQDVYERSKRSMTTICVEIKPSSPQDEPYFMCKGGDLPKFSKGINSNTRFEPAVPVQSESHGPSYNDAYSQNTPNQEYSTQFTQNQGIAAPSEQTTGSKNFDMQKPLSGFAGFRDSENFSPSQEQQQQFFPSARPFQYGYEQQQQFNAGRQDKSPTSIPQSAFGTRLSTARQQNAPNSQGPTSDPTTETQASYEPQYTAEFRTGANRPVSGFRHGGPQSGSNTRGNVFGGGTSSQLPNESTPKRLTAPGPNGRSYAQSSFTAASFPTANFSPASQSQTVLLPPANAESAPTAKYANAQATPPGFHVVPQTTQFVAASHLIRPETQSTFSRYREMIDEDVFRQPNWGFSPEELMGMRSMANAQEDPRFDFPIQQNVPADYMDDPVMRQFYASLHDAPTLPAQQMDPFLTSQALYDQTQSKTAKNCPTSVESHRQLPYYTARTATSQPAITQRPPDSATCCSHLPPCDTNYQRSYSYQPVFIALPCYGQQPAFGNLALNSPQFSYPSYGDGRILLGSPAVVPTFGIMNPTVGSVNPAAQYYQQLLVAQGMKPKVEMPQPQKISDADPILGSRRVFHSKDKAEKTVTPNSTTEKLFEEDADEEKPEEEQSSAESKKNVENASSLQATDTTDMDSDELFDSPKTVTDIPKTTAIGNNSREQRTSAAAVSGNVKPPTNKSETARNAGQKSDTPQMEEETQKSFDSLMSLAKIAKNFNKEEFAGTAQSGGSSAKTSAAAGVTARKGKRQNVRAGTSGGTGAKRQYVQRL